MKKLRIIALVAAFVTALALYRFLDVISQPEEIPRTSVVVALADIPENTEITAEMVTTQEVVTEAVQPNAYTDLDTVVGMVAKSEILAGEQVVAGRLAQMGETDTGSDTLAYVVEPGMRAVTVAVSDTTGLAAMLKPGNHVDVIYNYSYTAADGTAVVESRMILQDIDVLAVGAVLSRGGVDADTGYATVTLMVTPDQAVTLSFTEYTSNLRLILRSPLDTEQAQTAAVQNSDFAG